jgi:hypothetical protein
MLDFNTMNTIFEQSEQSFYYERPKTLYWSKDQKSTKNGPKNTPKHQIDANDSIEYDEAQVHQIPKYWYRYVDETEYKNYKMVIVDDEEIEIKDKPNYDASSNSNIHQYHNTTRKNFNNGN